MKRKFFLEKQNAHPRDKRVRFDEASHTYTLDGDKLKGSVSSFWGTFFTHFNAPVTIRRCYAKWKANEDDRLGYALLYMRLVDGVVRLEDAAIRLQHTGADTQIVMEYTHAWQSADHDELNDKGYYHLIRYLSTQHHMGDGDIKRAIATFWQRLGTAASTAGTYMHRQLELKANCEPYDAEMPEMRLHEQFIAENPHLANYYRTEWSIYSKALLLAGQIDLVVRDTTRDPPKYYIVDYKRVAAPLTTENPYNKFGKYPFDKVPDTSAGHYFLQQSIYQWLVEKLYGIRIEKCYLLQLHPNMQRYHLLEVPNLQHEVGIAMRTRRAEIKRSRI